MNDLYSLINIRLTIPFLLGFLLCGCATTQTSREEVSDPLEKVNRVVYRFNDKIDRYALKPIATGYRKVTPTLVRRGVSNFFGNLADVSVAANSLLQGKFKQSLNDTARVGVNTILGLGGLFDVATKLDLVRHNEDFGQTLGVWGVPEGPYLVLPFFGPQTVRSTAGLLGNSQIEPLNSNAVSESTRGKLVALNVVNARANLLAASSILDSASLDPYVFVRDGYLDWRRQQVHDGEIPSSQEDDIDLLDELDGDFDDDDFDLIDELDRFD
ncbi:hypothetical protein AB833_11370 [Chromatiales bacterium (ex Bugula neritina AB1)]|nr:hypothetical protein AB833_11370 [Chromatiales bacterium (ex Bugula neritina AB1)]